MPIPLENVEVPESITAKNKYDWESWLVPGRNWTFVQENDFPGTSLESFRQALRNACGRRRLAYTTHKVDEITVNVWIHGYKNDRQLPAQN